MRTHKIIVLSFVLIIGLLLALAPASASTVAVQFVGMSGANQNGVYTYPYYLTINGSLPAWMMCDDFYDRIGVGDSWQANITQLSSGDMSLTRFGDLTKYEEAGYLPGVEYWLNKAETVDLSTINFSDVRILTPTGDGGQEFLFMTPEPGTLLLVGTGFLGLWARRKRRA